jgi:pyrroline-5-carboxylate reductase
MSSEIRIGFFGAGKMASALASGFVRAGLTTGPSIMASDPVALARSSFAEATGAKTTASNLDVVAFAKTLILAVKPDQIESLLTEVGEQINGEHLLISIAAGVPLSKLEARLPAAARVIRVMPNTPALVGASASAFALGNAASADDAQTASNLLSAVGLAFQVKETLLDAVTGLSGSGPAYIYILIEALSDGGVACGLPREISTKLAAQTVLGSAKMVLETGLHPGALKDMVTSPGGTTIEGVHELEKGGLRAAMMAAVRSATEKAKRIGAS